MVVQLLTVGHGNLSQAELAALLTEAGVATLVDVRRFPGSRRNPHFAADAMSEWVEEAGVHYFLEQRLGGRRRIDRDQRDADPWWQVEAFRAYAAHTRSEEFAAGMADLLETAGLLETTGLLATTGRGRTAVMCSESVWWRCHRRLISDVAVLLHGVEVLHLAHSGKLTEHVPAAGARIADDGLRYDVLEA